MANLITGIEIIDGWTDELNRICQTVGSLERDNHTGIWDPWLHKLTTDEWRDIHHALDTLRDLSPMSYTNSDLDTLLITRNILESAEASIKPRIMDTKDYKKYAWRQMCSMREIVNRYNGIDIPNKSTK